MNKLLFPLLAVAACSRWQRACTAEFIQRLFYLLQSFELVPGLYPFLLYKHGPLSTELEDVLAELRADCMISARASIKSSVTYELTEFGINYIRRNKEVSEAIGGAIDCVVEQIAKLDSERLDLISTAGFLDQHNCQSVFFHHYPTALPGQLDQATRELANLQATIVMALRQSNHLTKAI